VSIGDVAAGLGLAMFLVASVVHLIYWGDPASKWFTAYRGAVDGQAHSKALRQAAMCVWLTFGFACGSPVGLYSLSGLRLLSHPVENAAAITLGCLTATCVAVGIWVRYGSAPQGLRPSALRDP